jgi:hypothetical protein
MVDDATFWKRWNGPNTVYMAMKKNTYNELQAAGHKNVYLVSESGDNVLAVNKEMMP